MTRSPEAALYVAQLEWLLMQIHDALGHIPEGMLGWAPHEGANPARVIARHAMAVTSVYVLGFGCGADAFMERDRRAESWTSRESQARPTAMNSAPPITRSSISSAKSAATSSR